MFEPDSKGGARAVSGRQQATFCVDTVGNGCRALVDGDVVEGADLAERYWDEAAPVPVSRIQPLLLLTAALLATASGEHTRTGYRFSLLSPGSALS